MKERSHWQAELSCEQSLLQIAAEESGHGCTQDVSGGQPVPVEGTALPLWGLEIDPDRARDDFRAFNARDDGKVRTPIAGHYAMHNTRPCHHFTIGHHCHFWSGAAEH